jgi:ABC-type nitrate/sulfonate/bicarbonate transport system substrate-binding protein
MILWRILADHGVDFRTGDPPLIPVGTTSLRLESMSRGETFAAIVSSGDLEDAQARGFRVLGHSRDYLPDYPAPDCGTTRRWAAANQDALVRFIRAWVAATEWALHPANREQALAIYMRETGESRDLAESRFEQITPDARVNIPGIQIILDLRTALGFLPGGGPVPPAERFYETRYWEQATGRRHSQ